MDSPFHFVPIDLHGIVSYSSCMSSFMWSKSSDWMKYEIDAEHGTQWRIWTVENKSLTFQRMKLNFSERALINSHFKNEIRLHAWWGHGEQCERCAAFSIFYFVVYTFRSVLWCWYIDHSMFFLALCCWFVKPWPAFLMHTNSNKNEWLLARNAIVMKSNNCEALSTYFISSIAIDLYFTEWLWPRQKSWTSKIKKQFESLIGSGHLTHKQTLNCPVSSWVKIQFRWRCCVFSIDCDNACEFVAVYTSHHINIPQ